MRFVPIGTYYVLKLTASYPEDVGKYLFVFRNRIFLTLQYLGILKMATKLACNWRSGRPFYQIGRYLDSLSIWLDLCHAPDSVHTSEDGKYNINLLTYLLGL